jgi:hypothetical protein
MNTRRCTLLAALTLAAALLGLAAVPASADLLLTQAPELPGTRAASLGGTHVALGDDLSSLFSNPAGFAHAGPQMSLAELTVGLGGPVFSLADFVLQIMGGADPLTLLTSQAGQDLFRSLYASAGLNGPIAFGYVGNGLGFGFFNTTGVTFTTVGTLPTVSAEVKEDILFLGGYSFTVPLPPQARSTLDIGLMLKTYVEGKVSFSQSILSLLALLASPDFGFLLSQPFSLVVGAGLDAGVLYSWNNLISVGIVGRNIPTFTLTSAYPSVLSFSGTTPVQSLGYAPVDLAAGLMFTPSLGYLDRYITHLKIFLDYGDILDFWLHPATAKNWILHFGVGTELSVLEVLSLRVGFGDGYFSTGVGLNLSFCQLNVAMFGQELSGQPGLRPVFNMLVGLEFRI